MIDPTTARLRARDVPMIVRVLLCADVLLVVAHVVNDTAIRSLDRPSAFFDLDVERSLPTWYSVLQLALLGALLSVFARHALRRRDPTSWPLAVAAAVPFYASFDEFKGLHARFTKTGGGFAGSWVWVVAPAFVAVVVGIAVVSRRHWWGPRRAHILLGVGIGLYLLAAAGLELVPYVADSALVDRVEVPIEELGEMVAVTFMIWGVLVLLAARGIGSSGEQHPGRSSAGATTGGAA